MSSKDQSTEQAQLNRNSVTGSTDVENAVPGNGKRATKEGKPRWLVVLCVLAVLLPIAWFWNKDLTARKLAGFETACRQAIEKRDWTGLIESSSAWAAWDADAADALLYQSYGFQELGELNRAAELLLRLPNESPKAEAALLVAASLYFEDLGQPQKAIPVLERLLKVNRMSITAHQRLIFFYGITLQRVKMLDQIRQALEVGAEPPDSYVYLHLAGRLTFTNGYRMNQRWLRQGPDNKLFRIASVVQMNTAKDLAVDADEEPPGEKEARYAEVKELLREYPGDTALLRYLLHLAVKRFDVDDVGTLLSASPDHAWKDSVFWRFRGWYHHQVGEFDEARKAFEKSIELYPQDWETWHHLAATFRKQKDLDNAERAQRVALQGKELRKSILQLADARAATPEIMASMRDYCAACGDELAATSLQTRIQLMTGYR